MDIYKTIRNTINQYQMTAPGMHVIAAVSGGADSVCLLLALKELSKELDITVEAFHLHHGLRGAEADRDADFVKDLCAGDRTVCRRKSLRRGKRVIPGGGGEASEI